MTIASRQSVLRLACALLAAGAAAAPARAQAPAAPLVPLQDEVMAPLLPAGIHEAPARLSSSLVYLWPDPQGGQALHAVGGFEFELGAQKIRAGEAVVWLSGRRHQDRDYTYIEMFLAGDAHIVDPGGVLTQSPALFVTAATFGKVQVSADRTARESHDAEQVYRDALTVRQAVAAGTVGLGPTPLTSLALPPSAQPEERPVETYIHAEVQPERINDEMVYAATTGIYFARGQTADPDYMEARAQAAVIFAEAPGAEPAPDSEAAPPPLAGLDLAGGRLKAIYLEGDVVLTQGERLVRASKLYYDLQNQRALILDPVLRVPISSAQVPLYVRATEARQLSESEFTAQQARIGLSEFHTPHYHIGAEELHLVAEESRTPEGVSGGRSGAYRITDATFNLENFPLLYWPEVRGNFTQGEIPLRAMRVALDGNFGFSLETSWHLFNLLGLETPPGFDNTFLDADYYYERGPGLGIRSDYQLTRSFGELDTYFLYDDEDEDELGPLRDETIPRPSRGRATWRHRQFLEDDWQIIVEGSYLSDRNFLEEFFEREFDTGKEQETYIQLKKQRDNWAFDLVGQVRVHDWLTQTERLPEASFRLVGQPIGPLTAFSENRAGVVRHRPDEERVFISAANNVIDNRVRSGAVLRGDTRQELEWPFNVGPLRFVPFITGRGTHWDDSIAGGGIARALGLAGLRSSAFMSRVYDGVESALWNLRGLRHVVKFDAVGWVSGSSRDSMELYPFDEDIEGLDGVSGGTFGIRQRWQTHRGSGERERVVDWITLDLESGLFSNTQGDERTNGFASFDRPEESIGSNYVSGDFSWRAGDSTLLLADANYDLDEGDLDIANISVAIERDPRLSYAIGWRLIGESESNLFGVGANYRFNEKHAFALRSYFDIDRGSSEQVDLTYIRKFPRWYMGLTFALDEIEDNISVSMSVWPEGFPNVALGGKRYTGLATTTALAP